MKKLKTKSVYICLATIFIVFMIFSFTGCSNSSNSSYDSSADGKYGYGEKYDENVNDIADAYGEDPDDVNAKINAVVDAANNN